MNFLFDIISYNPNKEKQKNKLPSKVFAKNGIPAVYDINNPLKFWGYMGLDNHDVKLVIKKNNILAYIDALKIEIWVKFVLILIPIGMINKKAIYTDIIGL